MNLHPGSRIDRNSIAGLSMSSRESDSFPCPECGDRGDHIPCKRCGWDPDVDVPMRTQSEPYSKSAALMIGVLTLLPFAYMFFFFAMMMAAIAGAGAGALPKQDSFMILFAVHAVAIIVSWCLVGFYIYYLFKTDFVQQDQKTLWAVVLFLGNILVMPVFWYLHIWKPAETA
jgi:uncharacterized paraquat-inducible protein A